MDATGIGRRIGEAIRFTDLFERFKVHDGFDATFYSPDTGHEKGNVEANIGYLHRQVMVPPPILQSWDGANDATLAQAPTHTVVMTSLQDPITRGVTAAQGLLVVIDGAKALAKAVREVWGHQV